MNQRQILRGAALATLLAGRAQAQAKQAYPSRPISLVIGYAPGGTADISWRIIAPKLAERLGQSIVVQNKPGAGGIIASQAVLQAPADGYTFILAATGNFGITPVLFKSLPFDAVKDFQMVSLAADFDYVFAVKADSPFKTVKDVIDYARRQPGKLTIGTVQVGSAQFFAAELFKSMAGISAVTVPFHTSGDVVRAVRAGDAQVMVETIAPVISQIGAGVLRAIGITGSEPFPGLPGVPPISRSGLDGYVVTAWNGLAAKAGTPRAAVDRVNRELAAVLALPEVKSRFLKLGMVARHSTPEALRARQLADIKKWGAVMQTAHIQKQ